MAQLQPPDTQHLEAAQGWLDLGNHIEANEELKTIEAENCAQAAASANAGSGHKRYSKRLTATANARGSMSEPTNSGTPTSATGWP
jgi:hypothetical protein